MRKGMVVGPVSKPSPEELLKMYETLDRQVPEIRRQFKEGSLVTDDIQAVIEHRDQVIVVVSDGLNAEQQISKLETAGFNVWPEAKFIMRSGDAVYVVTNGVTYGVAIIKGDEFDDNSRTTENVRKEADRRRWIEPPVELARLLREKISDEELERMGLWWLVVMHKTILVSVGNPSLLGLSRGGRGRELRAFCGSPSFRWSRKDGFAFLVQQVSE
jgi:hypothetical protein